MMEWPQPSPVAAINGTWRVEDQSSRGILVVLSNESLELRLESPIAGFEIVETMVGEDDLGKPWTLMGLRFLGFDSNLGFRWRPLHAWKGVSSPAILDLPIVELALHFPGMWFASTDVSAVELEQGAVVGFDRDQELVKVTFSPPRPLGHMASYATWLTLAPFVICNRSIRPRRRLMTTSSGIRIEVFERKRPTMEFRAVGSLWRRMPPLAHMLVKAWEVWNKAPRAAEAFMSFHEAHVFQNERFLLLAMVLEVYHRAFGASGKLPSEQLEIEIQRITLGLTKDDRERVDGLLRNANDHSLTTRLEQLSQGLPCDPVQVRKFIKDFKEARNRLIHRTGIAHVDARDVGPFTRLINRTEALAVSILLAHLGASKEACDDFVTKHWDTATIWTTPIPSSQDLPQA